MESDVTKSFVQIVNIIEKTRENTFKKVNEELIMMYWNIGNF